MVHVLLKPGLENFEHYFASVTLHAIHGHHQMVNIKIRLSKLFAVTDGEALYSQQKQVQGLTVSQIMSSSLPNSDLN